MTVLLKNLVIFVLTLEARLALWRYAPKIIAITGSMGKTTTKDAIYAVLSKERHVQKSEKSFNSEIGVPLAILGLENAWRSPTLWLQNLVRGLWLIVRKLKYPEWLILEVGADRPGDIRRIARWLRPHIVVMTGVPEIPVHVEYFRSPDELAREKCALVEHMQNDGTLILNGDDSRMASLCADHDKQTVTYGLGNRNELYASHLSIAYERKMPVGMRFKLNHAGTAIPIAIRGALGRPRAYAALAAYAAAKIFGVELESVRESLEAWTPPPGRMRIVPGARGSTIIDDTYNSSPAAALAALDTLKEIKMPDGARRIALLGDMLELGKYAAEAHRNVGTRVATSADMLITVGFRSRAAAEAALDAGASDLHVRQYEQHESRRAGEELRNELREGDVVLIKGSQSMRMERAVEALMAESERAANLLVRQEPEWLLKT